MGMFTWTERPAQVLQQGGVIGPEERLPWPQTAAMGVQHVIAMFGATVLAPILMGFDPNVAILMSGLGTLIFFVITGGRVPTLVVHDRGDAINAFADGQAFAHAVQGAQLLATEGLGHRKILKDPGVLTQVAVFDAA